MKTKFTLTALALLTLSTFNSQLSTCFAQGTAFTYQGRLNNNGAPASGSYDLMFTLYDSTNQPGTVIAGPLTNSATSVTNGLFTATLDFGAGIFTGNPRWLEIAVRSNGGGAFSTLSPRQQITPTPYAIMANGASNLLGTLPTSQLMGTFPASQLSGTIPSADLSGTYSGPVTFNNGADTFDGTFIGQFIGSSFLGGTFSGQFVGDGSGLINLNPSHIAGSVAFLNSNQVFTAQNIFLQGIGIGNNNPSPFYQIDALASQSNTRFVTTNNNNGAVIELKNQITNYNYSYLGAINFNNYLDGYPGQIGYFAVNPTNENNDFMQFRVGGAGGALTLQADPRGEGVSSLIGGTWWNSVDPSSGGNVIVGGGFPGAGNIVYSNSFGVFIGAGSANQIGPNVNDSVIAGGYGNGIQAFDSFIGGGVGNTNAGGYSFIGGGYWNWVQGYGGSVIGGGYYNLVASNINNGFIGGGFLNAIQFPGSYAGIGGGSYNQNAGGYSFIGGGYDNWIQPTNAGSVIGGGYHNTIATNNYNAVIGGGSYNIIDSYNLYSTIGGGYDNIIHGDYYYFTNYFLISSTIAGGAYNTIQTNAPFSTIGGGYANNIQTNTFYATIAGGGGNQVSANAGDAAIGGGINNIVGGFAGTVPGGYNNAANGYASFAAGYYAKASHYGSFVLADASVSSNFNSTADNQLSGRFTGGVRFETAGAGLTLDDQPVVFSSYANVVTLNNAGNSFNGTFTGNGGGLTGLNASQLTSGTVPAGVFSGNYTNAVTLTNAGNVFAGNGTGLTNVNAALLNGLPATAFAPANGSTNYIQNQNSGLQNASFQISGSAQIGGTVSAAALVVSNVTASGTVAVNALTISNSFRVAGAGLGTGTAAFVQLSAATNVVGDSTFIYNPLCDGDPNAILLVIHNYDPPGAPAAVYNKTVGVWYNAGHWAIYNEDQTIMSSNIAFNVLIVKH